MSLSTQVMQDIAVERDKQDTQWGGPANDDNHFPQEWLAWIDHQIERGCAEDNNSDGNHNWRERYIKIAALCIAAVESLDRKALP